MKKKNPVMALVFAQRLFIGALALAGALSPAPAHADVHGFAYGFVQTISPNFDGLGSCRMVLLNDRYAVVDFPAGELADACEAATPGGFHYFEAIVDDAELIPCTPKMCGKTSAMGHFIAAEVVIP